MIHPLHEHIAAARRRLVDAGLSPGDATLDADVLARHVLHWDRAQLLTRQHQPPPGDFEAAFKAAIDRRAAREPVALITGHREFWGLEFEVTRDVLIPRPETEILVEEALAFLKTRPDAHVVDVGTGSGCIAVALAVEAPGVRVRAIDQSDAALAVAARNVARHQVEARVVLTRGHLLDPVTAPVDVIVSNPPYVDRRDLPTLQPEVTRYEPHAALFADEDGFAILRQLCDAAVSRLAPGGRLIVEFGAGQAPRLREIAEAYGWQMRTVKDLAGIDRVAVLQRAVSREP